MKTEIAGTCRQILNPSFLVVCAVLAGAVFGVSPRVFKYGDTAEKGPLSLQKSLKELTTDRIGPYELAHRNSLSEAIESELDALDYIDWHFIDQRIADKEDPMRYVRLFVTYYSGGRNMVPHTPDYCMLGAGYAPGLSEDIDFDLPAVGKFPMRVLDFTKTSIYLGAQITVLYTFRCNDKFVCTRDGVRLLINSPHDHYAYFAKIEVSFGSEYARPIHAPRADSIRGAREFLDVVMPVLIDAHFPDWTTAEAKWKKQMISKQVP